MDDIENIESAFNACLHREYCRSLKRGSAQAVGSAPSPLFIAFTQGAKWWEYQKTGATMRQSDQKEAKEEADRRGKNGTLGKLPYPVVRRQKGRS